MQYVVMDEYGQFTVVDEIHGAEVHDDRYYKKEEIYWLAPVNTYDDLPLTGNQHGDASLILTDKNIYVWIEEAGYDENGDPAFVGEWLPVIGNYWNEPVASFDDLPLTGNLDGEVRLVEVQNALFRWNESTSTWVSIVAASWRAPVDTYNDLPLTGNGDGDVRLVLDTNQMYRWDSSTTEWVLITSGSINDLNDLDDLREDIIPTDATGVSVDLGKTDAPFANVYTDDLYVSGGEIHMPNMKSGTDQANAGAAAGELYFDTNDDNTVKMGV